MKKRFTIGLMGLMFCTAMQAQVRTVELQCSGVEDYPKTNGPSYEIPTVNYDKDYVSISADTLIYNVGVVIRDCYGNVIYSGKTTVNPADRRINLPQKYQGRKYTVEIYYDDKYLYGYFEK